MIHQGQRFSLGFEAGDHRVSIHPQLDDLDGHAATDGASLLGEINHAHPPLTQESRNLVWADALRQRARWRAGHTEVYGRSQARITCGVVVRQQPRDSLPKGRGTSVTLIQDALPLSGGQIRQLLEEFLYLSLEFRIHLAYSYAVG
jgi:hypothetical protein